MVKGDKLIAQKNLWFHLICSVTRQDDGFGTVVAHDGGLQRLWEPESKEDPTVWTRDSADSAESPTQVVV